MLVVFGEMPASQRNQPILGGMIHDLVSDDALRGQRSVFVHIVPEVGQPGVTTDDQHLRNAIKRIADLAVELVFGAYATGVLTREPPLLVNPVDLHMVGVELQYICRMMVDEADRVK